MDFDIADTLVVSDLDGTLLGPDASIGAASRLALTRAAGRGLALSFATGRNMHTGGRFLSEPFFTAPCILMNGAVIAEPGSGRVAERVLMERAAQARLEEILSRSGKSAFVHTADPAGEEVFCAEAADEADAYFAATRSGPGSFIMTKNPFSEGECFYAIMCGRREDLHALHAAVGRESGLESVLSPDDYSEWWFLECFSSLAGKRNGLRRLRELTGKTRTVCFGDSFNDIGMLEEADLGLAVMGARPEVIARAKRTCSRPGRDAVALEILDIFGIQAAL